MPSTDHADQQWDDAPAGPAPESIDPTQRDAERRLWLVVPAPEPANDDAPPEGSTDDDHDDGAEGPGRARRRRRAQEEVATTLVGVAGGEAARRAIAGGLNRQQVIDVARHVAKRQLKDATDAEVMQFIISNRGFRKSLAGHLHEHLDAKDLKRIYELRKALRMSEGRWLQLYAEHNRKGLDGAYKGARKTGEACFAQHKLSEKPQQLRKAAAKVHKRVRGKTELVVPRGTKKKVTPEVAAGLKGVRETGRSAKEIRAIVEKAADPRKARDVGTNAPKNLSVKAGLGAAAASAGMRMARDLNKVRKGEMRASEAAENAAWAGGEAALSTLATAGVTMAAAPTIAAGTAALAGSTVAGTTVMAAGLATLGPVGVGVGVGVGIGVGVKKARQVLRG